MRNCPAHSKGPYGSQSPPAGGVVPFAPSSAARGGTGPCAVLPADTGVSLWVSGSFPKDSRCQGPLHLFADAFISSLLSVCSRLSPNLGSGFKFPVSHVLCAQFPVCLAPHFLNDGMKTVLALNCGDIQPIPLQNRLMLLGPHLRNLCVPQGCKDILLRFLGEVLPCSFHVLLLGPFCVNFHVP